MKVRFRTVREMAEVMSQLEALAYLAKSATSVADRRVLDELLRRTDTQVDADEAESLEVVIAA